MHPVYDGVFPCKELSKGNTEIQKVVNGLPSSVILKIKGATSLGACVIMSGRYYDESRQQ